MIGRHIVRSSGFRHRKFPRPQDGQPISIYQWLFPCLHRFPCNNPIRGIHTHLKLYNNSLLLVNLSLIMAMSGQFYFESWLHRQLQPSRERTTTHCSQKFKKYFFLIQIDKRKELPFVADSDILGVYHHPQEIYPVAGWSPSSSLELITFLSELGWFGMKMYTLRYLLPSLTTKQSKSPIVDETLSAFLSFIILLVGGGGTKVTLKSASKMRNWCPLWFLGISLVYAVIMKIICHATKFL